MLYLTRQSGRFSVTALDGEASGFPFQRGGFLPAAALARWLAAMPKAGAPLRPLAPDRLQRLNKVAIQQMRLLTQDFSAKLTTGSVRNITLSFGGRAVSLPRKKTIRTGR